MPDVHDKETRSRNMAAIKSKNTKPEMIVRKLLHSKGFRYRIHDKVLPGKPDLVFPKYRAVVFVHGCFWHGHNCHLFKVPRSRTEFWLNKIGKNKENDFRCIKALKEMGYRIMTIWECGLKGTTKLEPEKLVNKIANWLKSSVKEMTLPVRSAA